MCDSRMNRWRNSSSHPKSVASSFRATFRPSRSCSATYTTLIPPRPSRDSIRNPAISDPIRVVPDIPPLDDRPATTVRQGDGRTGEPRLKQTVTALVRWASWTWPRRSTWCVSWQRSLPRGWMDSPGGLGGLGQRLRVNGLLVNTDAVLADCEGGDRAEGDDACADPHRRVHSTDKRFA